MRSIRVMCTDRHGIFNYLRIQSEFRAPRLALFSVAPSPLFRRYTDSFFLFFFPSCLPLFSSLRISQEASLSTFNTFGVIKAHTTFRISPYSSYPLSVVAHTDMIAPVAQLQRYRTHYTPPMMCTDRRRTKSD